MAEFMYSEILLVILNRMSAPYVTVKNMQGIKKKSRKNQEDDLQK